MRWPSIGRSDDATRRVRELAADVAAVSVGPHKAIWRLKVASCLTLLIPLLICWPLWRSERSFPAVPWVSGMRLPPPLDLALFLAWLGCILAVLVLPRPRRIAWSVSGLALVLVVFDQNRLQPWLYEFMLLFPALAMVEWGALTHRENRRVWAVFAFGLAAIYFYSGVQKMHPGFASEVFAELLEPLVGRPAWVLVAGHIAPFLEASIGVLLVFSPTRRLGACLAIAMHAFLLVALGPFGLAYNAVVWPWNLGMASLVWIVAWREPGPIIGPLASTTYGRAAVLLFGFMPLLNFAGLWDAYLSFSLYSGRVVIGRFTFRPEAAMKLPEDLTPYLVQKADGTVRLDVLAWAIGTIRVPVYPEVRVYQAIAKEFCRRGIASEEMGLVVFDPPALFSPRPKGRILPCCKG